MAHYESSHVTFVLPCNKNHSTVQHMQYSLKIDNIL